MRQEWKIRTSLILTLTAGLLAACAGEEGTLQDPHRASQTGLQAPADTASQAIAPAKVQYLRVKSTDDVTLHVRVAGNVKSGRVMLVVHGGPGVSHEYLLALAELAGDSFAVVHYDQRGTGKSTKGTEGASYGFEAQRADIEAIRQRLKVEQLHVFGFSWGGIIAQDYVSALPEHVKSLTTFGSVPPTQADFDKFYKASEEPWNELVAEGKIPDPWPTDRLAQLQALAHYEYVDPTKAPPEFFVTTYSDEAYTRVSADMQGFDLRAALKRYTGPALVLVGDSDPFSPQMSAPIHEALPQSEYVVFPHTGHNIHEAAGEFFPLIRRFLDAADPVSPPHGPGLY